MNARPILSLLITPLSALACEPPCDYCETEWADRNW